MSDFFKDLEKFQELATKRAIQLGEIDGTLPPYAVRIGLSGVLFENDEICVTLFFYDNLFNMGTEVVFLPDDSLSMSDEEWLEYIDQCIYESELEEYYDIMHNLCDDICLN